MGYKMYVASSWRNQYQPRIVNLLREEGHEIYDFRNPKKNDNGFHWSEIDPNWQEWSPSEYRKALWNPIAEDAFKSDMDALKWADAIVLLLPSGRSAHSEAAWGCGQGTPVVVHIPERCESELMYKMFNVITCTDIELREIVNIHLSQLKRLCLKSALQGIRGATIV